MIDDLRARTVKAILVAGLVAGTCDILDPILIWTPRGVTVTRIFQSVATGLLGRAAFTGGLPTALLGAFLHFFIATGWAAVFVAISLRVPALRRKPLLYGPLFGLCVYVAMYYVVLPLSASGARAQWTPWALFNNIGIHMIGIGLPIALIASRMLGPRDERANRTGTAPAPVVH
jgi:hypothetical protein